MILYSYIWCNKLCKRSQVSNCFLIFPPCVHTQHFQSQALTDCTYPDIFWSANFSLRIQKIPRPRVSVFKWKLPFPARIRLVSGFTLVPRTPLGKLATKLSMRRKAREIWPIQPSRCQKNAKSKVDSSTGNREEVFILNRVFTVKNWARSYYVTG